MSTQDFFRQGSISVLSSVLLTTAFPAFAQNYPSKPIRLIVGYSPGGSNDTVARIMAQKLSETLGVPRANSISRAPGSVARCIWRVSCSSRSPRST